MSAPLRHRFNVGSVENTVAAPTTVIVRLLVAVCLVSAVFIVAPQRAGAAIISVEGCVVDGAVVSVPVDDDTLDTYEGGWYTLHNAYGDPIDHTQPLTTFTEVPPVCVVPISGGAPDSSQATWAWCLEVYDAVCVEEPWEDRTQDVIDDRQMALVSWRISEWMTSGVTTTDSLIQTQLNIWCVTDDFQHPFLSAWGSAPGTVTNCNEYNDWLDANILPTLVTGADTLDISPSTITAQLDDDVVIAVDTTLAEVELVVSGADSFDVCAGETNATLSGSTLTIATPGTVVELCATRSTAGEISVSAASTAQHLIPAHTIGFDLVDCQVMATHTIPSTTLHKDVVVSFAAADTTPATTSTTSTTTTTTTIAAGDSSTSGPQAAAPGSQATELAVGGTHIAALLATALTLCITGFALVATTRRQYSATLPK